jgi:hypothetical protein
MKIGEWYVQRFSDQEMFFQARDHQKNGGMAGIFYTIDMMRPRAKAKPKKGSVSAHEVRHLGRALWRWIPPMDVPFDRFAL